MVENRDEMFLPPFTLLIIVDDESSVGLPHGIMENFAAVSTSLTHATSTS